MRLERIFGIAATLCLVALEGAAPVWAAPATPAASVVPATPPARPPRIASSDFTQRDGLDDMSLSPDGNHIALKATTKDGKVYLAVLDAATRASQHSLLIPDKNTLDWYRWAGNRRILVSLSQLGTMFEVEVRYTRLFVFDLDSATFTLVGNKTMGIVGNDLIYTDPAGEYVLLSIQRNIYEYPGVWRFPLDGTAAKNGVQVQGAKDRVWSWFADDKGAVRMGFQFLDTGAFKVLYRRGASDDFKTIAKITENNADDTVWNVLRIISGSDEGFVLTPNAAGQMVLRKFNYATRTPGETIFAAPDGWDLTDLALTDANQPLAVSYTDDHDRTVWFDPRMKRLQTRLEKALPGNDIQIVSRASDGSRMLVWTGSENDPGAMYVYTAADSRLDLMVGYKATLDPATLPRPRPIEFKARDGTLIHGYLTMPLGRASKNLPLIVLPHGGPYGVRDKLDFDYEVQFLANRGYAVLQPNYRGSTGYGKTFEDLGAGQIGRKMQDDIDDAMDWAVAQGYADAKRVCVVGASYGGYAALWAVTRNPERYRCAASFAGVTDWNKQLAYDRDFFSRKGAKKWRSRMVGEEKGFNLDLVSPVEQIRRLTRPVLLVHGEADTTVPYKQFKLLRDAAAKAGKPLELLTFAKEGHGFDRKEDATKWLDTLEAFLLRNNPPD